MLLGLHQIVIQQRVEVGHVGGDVIRRQGDVLQVTLEERGYLAVEILQLPQQRMVGLQEVDLLVGLLKFFMLLSEGGQFRLRQ